MAFVAARLDLSEASHPSFREALMQMVRNFTGWFVCRAGGEKEKTFFMLNSTALNNSAAFTHAVQAAAESLQHLRHPQHNVR